MINWNLFNELPTDIKKIIINYYKLNTNFQIRKELLYLNSIRSKRSFDKVIDEIKAIAYNYSDSFIKNIPIKNIPKRSYDMKYQVMVSRGYINRAYRGEYITDVCIIGVNRELEDIKNNIDNICYCCKKNRYNVSYCNYSDRYFCIECLLDPETEYYGLCNIWSLGPY